jgi:hypothetical protein
MTKKLSDWNIFVKKIYTEGKAKDSNYEFKQALQDASKRKSEMKHSMSSKTAKKNRRSISSRRSRSRSASMAGGKKTKSKSRKHHRHRKH